MSTGPRQVSGGKDDGNTVSSLVAVIGLGEVGRPLLQILERAGRPAMGIDVDRATLPEPGSVDVMHICFPFEIPGFVDEVVGYMGLLEPRITVINSTVAVGTTRRVHERSGAAVAHSPIRGKHSRMVDELTSYVKYVGGIDASVATDVAAHFESIGIPSRVASCPEATELGKLTETTYFGLLIAWAQQVERYCDLLGLEYDEITSFYEEIEFFPPVRYYPGVIGGHCVMPNIEILSGLNESPILEAIRWSNAEKAADSTSGKEPRTAAGAAFPTRRTE
jgi:UDP-N-acetyl-D-mannosaminuronate dehydrogenase